MLCGVGKDRHSKTHIVLWNTSTLRPHPGEVAVLAQAHTDISIHTMKMAHFDERRYMYIHIHYECTVCVCVCVCVCVGVCARACVRACVCLGWCLVEEKTFAYGV